MTPLEISANAVTTISILLAGRNSVHTWWSGVIGCALFGWLFFESQLYADVTLQVFFMVTSLIGWWQWLKGQDGAPLPVARSVPRHMVQAVLAGLVVTFGYGLLLHTFTDAYAPFVDSAVLAFSVIAQVLLMRRRIETWLFWLIVNSLAVPLYFSRDLHLTAGLYGLYWVNALISWRHWKRELMSSSS